MGPDTLHVLVSYFVISRNTPEIAYGNIPWLLNLSFPCLLLFFIGFTIEHVVKWAAEERHEAMKKQSKPVSREDELASYAMEIFEYYSAW